MLKPEKAQQFTTSSAGVSNPQPLELAIANMVDTDILCDQQLKIQLLINRLWETKVLFVANNPQAIVLGQGAVSFVFSS
ncbi:MAG: hypothetical protein R3B84_09340 [Zavarzinella sp.]